MTPADSTSESPTVRAGRHEYGWEDSWLTLPRGHDGHLGWAHHDLVITQSRQLVAFHQDEPALLFFDLEGRLDRIVPVEVTEGHGMTLVSEDGVEYLWVADNGVKRRVADDGSVRVDGGPWPAQAVKLALDGRVVSRLRRPPLDVYETQRYAPSSVAVDEERLGGSGDIWVSDGYGQSMVHRYDKHGCYLGSLTGEEGAGRFDCPHGIFLDRRRDEAELYVGDRSNRRVQVYDVEGRFRRVFGEDFLVAPCSFAASSQRLLITELYGRVTVCDANDRLVGYLGQDEHAGERDGWPNEEVDGRVVRSTSLVPGRFNSPHGIAIDSDGSVYVSEWLLGGRFTRLVPVDPTTDGAGVT